MSKVKKIFKKVRHLIEYILFLIFVKTVTRFDIDRSSAICGRFARFIGPFLPHNKIAAKNLYNVFGDSINIKETVSQVWENFGRFIGEFVFVTSFMSKKEVEKRIEFVGFENVEKLRERNQPFILLMGHFSNWEFVLRILDKFYPKFAITYRKANNLLINKVIEDSRKQNNIILIPKNSDTTTDLIRAIKSAYSLVILSDQKFNQGIEVPFFDRQAKTSEAIAKLALCFNYPIIPCQIIRKSGAYFKCVTFPPIELNLTGDKKKDYYNVMVKINQTLESWILEHKEQWLWFHNRWGK